MERSLPVLAMNLITKLIMICIRTVIGCFKEAFCLFSEADKFKPYEKHHSTVKEACQLAEQLKVLICFSIIQRRRILRNVKQLYTQEGKEILQWQSLCSDDLESFEI